MTPQVLHDLELPVLQPNPTPTPQDGSIDRVQRTEFKHSTIRLKNNSKLPVLRRTKSKYINPYKPLNEKVAALTNQATIPG